MLGVFCGFLAGAGLGIFHIKGLLRDWMASNDRWREHCRELNQLWADTVQQMESECDEIPASPIGDKT